MISWQMLTSRDRILLKIVALVVGAGFLNASGPGLDVLIVSLLLVAAWAYLRWRASGGDAPPPPAKRQRKPPRGGAPVLATLAPRPVLSSGAARAFPPPED